jgi:hypothetical protein
VQSSVCTSTRANQLRGMRMSTYSMAFLGPRYRIIVPSAWYNRIAGRVATLASRQTAGTLVQFTAAVRSMLSSISIQCGKSAALNSLRSRVRTCGESDGRRHVGEHTLQAVVWRRVISLRASLDGLFN